MKLRPYQSAAVDAVLAAWKEVLAARWFFPDRMRQTVLFAEIIRRLNTRRAGAPRGAGVSGEGQDLPGDGTGCACGDGRVPGRHARRGADGGGLDGADAHGRR